MQPSKQHRRTRRCSRRSDKETWVALFRSSNKADQQPISPHSEPYFPNRNRGRNYSILVSNSVDDKQQQGNIDLNEEPPCGHYGSQESEVIFHDDSAPAPQPDDGNYTSDYIVGQDASTSIFPSSISINISHKVNKSIFDKHQNCLRTIITAESFSTVWKLYGKLSFTGTQ